MTTCRRRAERPSALTRGVLRPSAAVGGGLLPHAPQLDAVYFVHHRSISVTCLSDPSRALCELAVGGRTWPPAGATSPAGFVPGTAGRQGLRPPVKTGRTLKA